MFARIDSDRNNEITLDDYMKRDRFYVDSVRTEFNDIDTDRRRIRRLSEKFSDILIR